MKPRKRPIDVLVLSDLHLGTYGCRAAELLTYLRSVKPRMVILNGDIIDIWQFNKRYFPKEHMRVVKKLMKWSSRIPVYYITGNHDEALRRYSPARLGNLRLVDQLTLNLDGRSHWFFHGDIFDATMKNARWLAKLGGHGYDLLIRINHLVNLVLHAFGRPRMSFSRRVKNSVKSAVNFISDFEQTMAEIALHDGTCCSDGHVADLDRTGLHLEFDTRRLVDGDVYAAKSPDHDAADDRQNRAYDEGDDAHEAHTHA